MVVECVTVYMKESCPYSRELIRKLEHDGVDYVRYDVDEDLVRLEEMLGLNGGRRVVPTVVWPDKGVEIGFRGQ
jgi:glutaredoxin